MAYSYDAGTSTPTYAGLAEFNGIRINDGTFRSDHIPPLTDSPPLGASVTQFASFDGGSLGTPYYAPWAFDLTGWVHVPGQPDYVQAAIDQLKGVFNLANRNLQTLTLNSRGWSAARQMSVRINGQISATEPGIEQKKIPVRTFTIPLIAPDPRMYATSTSTATVALGGLGTTTNVTTNGTMSTPLTVRFTGPMTGGQLVLNVAPDYPQINLGSTSTIAAGDYIEITLNPAGTGGVTAVYSNGTNARPDIASGWTVYELPTGTSQWFVNSSGTSGASSVTLTWRDAWA